MSFPLGLAFEDVRQ